MRIILSKGEIGGSKTDFFNDDFIAIPNWMVDSNHILPCSRMTCFSEYAFLVVDIVAL